MLDCVSHLLKNGNELGVKSYQNYCVKVSNQSLCGDRSVRNLP